MSKRRFTDNEDDAWQTTINPDSKRIRIADGTSSSVNPNRYNPNWNAHQQQQQHAKSLMSDDEEDDDEYGRRKSQMDMDGGDATNNMSMEALAESSSFDNLLYQLASMNVGGNSAPSSSSGGGSGGAANVNGSEQIETCPICVARVPLSQFANHVYRCLDGMAPGERMDLRTQLERDEAMAFSMVQGQPNRYSQDMSYECPICGKMLSVGMSMNVHANECLDAQEADEASTAMGKFSIESRSETTMKMNDGDDDDAMMGSGSGSNRPKPMTRDQMSACANALLSNRKGSAEYDSMLSMFETLGFNERNIRRVVEEGKREKEMEKEMEMERKGREEEESGMTMRIDASRSMSFSSSSFPNAPPPTPMIGFGDDGVGPSGFGPGMFSNPFGSGSGMGNNDGNVDANANGFGDDAMDGISDSEL